MIHKMTKENILNILESGKNEFYQIEFNGMVANIVFFEFDVSELKCGKIFLPRTVREVIINEISNCSPINTAGMGYEITVPDLEGPTYAIAYEKDIPNKLGVIGHELGHIFLRHYEIECGEIDGIKNLAPQRERDADQFALDHFGEGPEVIKTVKQHIDKCAAVFGITPFRKFIAKTIMIGGLLLIGRTH